MPQRGDICLIPYPFTDKDQAKLRPTLVLQGFGPRFLALTSGEGSHTGDEAVFLPISSRLYQGQYEIVIGEDDPSFPRTGLKRASTIRCWNINTLSTSFIRRKIGKRINT